MSEFLSSLPNLYCAYQFTICIDESGNVWSCGINDKGKCGHNINKNCIFPLKQINNLHNILFIACGYYHTICCDYDGNVFSFGDNEYGQLGLNKTKQELEYSSIPQQVKLPPIKQISCGGLFSICLSYTGELWSFGDNYYGELGVGDTKKSPLPLHISTLSNIDYIISAGTFSFCKTVLNEYYSWGHNKHGQLAQGNCDDLLIPQKCTNIPDDLVSIRASAYHVLFLTGNGIVYSCGDNRYYQLGFKDKSKSLSIPKEISSLPFIKKISCGYKHSLCIDIDDNLWAFGDNKFGQLGLGHINEVELPIKVESIINIRDLSYGSYSTIIKTLENNIFVVGYNSHSQLGIRSDNTSIIDFIQVLKDKEYIWKTNISNSRAKSARK